MQESPREVLDRLMPQQHFSTASVAVLDFKTNDFECFHYNATDSTVFDLASLTKPLTLAASFHQNPELYQDEKLMMLLNHRASLPIGGRLSKENWHEQILAYPLEKQNQDTYSDYSALRLQLELEQKLQKPLYEIASPFWDDELYHWKKILTPFECVQTGMRRGETIQGVVHDDNAFVLKEELSHAGLFSTTKGLAQSLLNLFSKTQAFEHLSRAFSSIEENQRFILGWDRVQDFENSLAGKGASAQTFGHLGFTGTSIWIDLSAQKGWVLLSNATENYWYERSGLRQLRRELGSQIWAQNE